MAILGFTLRSFKMRVRQRRKNFLRFLSKINRNPPPGLDTLTVRAEKEVWREVDCLSCANCCKVMTPTYNTKDINLENVAKGMYMVTIQTEGKEIQTLRIVVE